MQSTSKISNSKRLIKFSTCHESPLSFQMVSFQHDTLHARPIISHHPDTSAPTPQLNRPHIRNLAFIHTEGEHRAHHMKAMVAIGTWIHVQQLVLPVGHDLADVRMTADKQAGPLAADRLPHPGVVTAGIAADVGHKDAQALAFKQLAERKRAPHHVVVDIAIHRFERQRIHQWLNRIQASNVSGMPYFICLQGVLQDFIAKITVIVRQ